MKKEQHKNSLKNLELVKKPVVWNGDRFESVTALRRHLGVSESTIYQALKHDYRLKGHYLDYAI
jgi:hypothetical protein